MASAAAQLKAEVYIGFGVQITRISGCDCGFKFNIKFFLA